MGFPFYLFFLAKKQDIAHLLPLRLTFFCVPMVTLDHQEGADTLLAIWQSSRGEREAYYLPGAFGVLYKSSAATVPKQQGSVGLSE